MSAPEAPAGDRAVVPRNASVPAVRKPFAKCWTRKGRDGNIGTIAGSESPWPNAKREIRDAILHLMTNSWVDGQLTFLMQPKLEICQMKLRRIVAGMICLCVWSLGASLQADPIIEETFTDYPDNALISVASAGWALGLAGNWTLAPNQDLYENRTHADLNAGTGKAVYDMESDYNGARRATRSTPAEHVLFENDGDVFYASFLIAPGRATGDMTFGLQLQRLDGGGMPELSFGISGGQYFVGNGGVNPNVPDGTVTADEQLVVVRIEYGDAMSGPIGPDDDEAVTLWVDPVDEFSAPVIDDALADLLRRGGGKITAASMRGDQMAGQPAFFDNLRVGLSFSAVVPEPSTLSLLALGFIALVPMIWRR